MNPECMCAGCGRRFSVIVVADPTGMCLTIEGLFSNREEKAPHCSCGGTTFMVTTVKR